jgi:hypothetical protein
MSKLEVIGDIKKRDHTAAIFGHSFAIRHFAGEAG